MGKRYSGNMHSPTGPVCNQLIDDLADCNSDGIVIDNSTGAIRDLSGTTILQLQRNLRVSLGFGAS